MTNKDLTWILRSEDTFRYRLLSRMQSDCEYYLGYGNRCARHLWAGNETDQISYMKALWNSFPDNAKPEWLSFDKILEYQKGFGIANSAVVRIICKEPRMGFYNHHLGDKFSSYEDALAWARKNIPDDYEFEFEYDVERELKSTCRDRTTASSTAKPDSVVPTEPTVWICVYKDTLGHPDDFDNLTDICVPTDWLLNILKETGEDPEEWFSEYTADATDDIALRALHEGVIFGCADTTIQAEVLNRSYSLANMIDSAKNRAIPQPTKAPEPDREPEL